MKKFTKNLRVIVMLLLINLQVKSQTTLVAGDIAFTGYLGFGASASVDQFSFVLLKNITSGTVINFTDNGWLSTNAFRTGETTVTWTSNSALVAGQEITIVGTTPSLASGTGSAGTVAGTALSFSANGDQILAYQGAAATPTFITAIHMNVYDAVNNIPDPSTTSAAAWDGVANTANSSALPTGLTTGVNAIWIGTPSNVATEKDNARFICAGNLSTVASIKTLIYDQTKWTTTDGDPASFVLPTGCNYVAAGAAPNITGQPSNTAICESSNASFSITTASVATYQWQVDPGTGFVNIVDDVIYSGATTTTLNITAAPFTINNTQYRCIATNGTGASTSNGASLTLTPLANAPTLQSKTPSSATVADGTSVSALFNQGSGGAICTDDFRYTTNGGATYLPYTPGANISTTGLAAGSGSVSIEGRRAGCSGILACDAAYRVLASWFVTPLPTSATTLNAGDIAFSGYNSNTGDDFSFVLLRNIGPGTAINFTNNGWLNTNVFRTGEESVTWTAPAGGLTAGTEIRIAALTATRSGGGVAGTVAGTAITLNINGDQVLAYRGPSAAPTFIAAIHTNVYIVANGDASTTTAAAWDGAANTINASALPTGLTTGVNAIWIGTQGDINSEFDNAKYGTCTNLATLGSIATLRSALNNQANWTKNNTSPGFTLPVGCNFLSVLAPVINVSGTPLAAFTACSGTASAEQTFNASGSNLTNNITITAPTGFEISTTSGSGFNTSITLTQSGGTVASTTIYVRLAATATGTPSGNITVASTGATSVNVAVSGTVNSIPSTPTITAGGPTTFCTGGSVTLTSSSTTGNVWSTSETTQSITVTTAGTYTVAVTSAGCTSATSAGTTVTVNPTPPTPTITAGGPTTFCTGGSVTLTSSSATGNVWSTSETTQSITVTTAGSYTVTVTSSGCTSAPSAGTTITVDPLPTTSNAGTDGTACINPGTFTMAANTPTVGSGIWSQAPGGPATASITSTSSPTTNINGLTTAGTYTFIWTISNGTCAPSRDTMTITVNPNPALFTLTGGGTFCPSTQTLTGPVDPNYTYIWQKSLTGISNPNSFTAFGGTTSTQNVTASGVYRLNVTNQFGCTTSDTTALSMADYVYNGSLAAGDAQQTGRLNRFATLSTCAAPKGCPLTFTTTGARLYDSYTITNPRSVPVCATIGLRSDCGTSLFNVAYLGSFDPTQPCANYLADPGSTFPGTAFYEATIPANGTIVVVVHEVNPGTGCTGYQLTVDVPRDMTAVTATPTSVNFNATSSLVAPIANSYLWSPGGATTQTITTAPITTTGTKYFVDLGYGNNGCTRKDSVTINLSCTLPVLTCPTNTTVAACQSQAAVNTAFATWLATASGTGGTNGVLTNNNTGAPSTCGGSTTVTFTYTNDCPPLVSTCQATFTVAAAPTVVLTAPTNTTAAACQTQAAVNTAFATWLATASASGGCNGVLTNNNTGAPSACGGSTTVTFTYNSSCAPLTTTAQATFTVTAAPTVVLTAPTNTTAAACQSQAAVNTAFATWLASASASGGCNGVLTNNNTGAPSACGGSTTVTFTYNSSCAPLTTTAQATFTVIAAPTVVLTAPTNTTAAACQTQAAVNTAFATWLATASASGGCNGVLTNNNTGAPSACGGSTTVTFTYNSSCAPLTTTAQATFTVTAAPTVVLTAPTNTTAAACQTQAAVNTAFATWLATASASGGCNGVLTNNNTGAPSACGGSTTVTFTYSSSCAPLTTTAQATFTVTAAPTVVLTAPTNTTAAACQTQAAVNTAFATWLATASASGGCNGVLTNNNTGAPSACGGSTTVTFTYNSSCAPLTTTAQATFTVTAAPTVVLTAPTNTTAAACQTQATVNTAFATWLATASASGGCNGVLTNNNTGAPSACGGSTTVTFTYSSSCTPLTTTAQATFTVTAAPTVVLTAPTNTTAAACQTQAAVNTAFATWLASASASGGCNGVLTNNNTGAPSACGGSTTVTFTYNSSCAPLTTTAQATFIVATPPTVVITCPAPTTVTCVALIPSANVNSVTIGAGCNVTITHRGDVISNQTCANKYLITRTYRGTDLCGNFVECTQLITVNDNVAPTITCPAAVTVCGVANVPAVNISSVTATDNCVGAVTVTHQGDVSTPSATAPYIITRTYRATDVCGNFTECTQLITVNPIATVNAIANQVVCNGSPVTAIAFGTTATGGTTTYAWTNNTTSIGLAASGTGNIATFNGINTGTAPVTATITVTPTFTNNAVSCTGTPSTFTITVNPTVVVNAVANQVVCNGSPVTAITFGTTATGGTTTYAWTNNTTSIGLAASGTGNIATFNGINTGTAPVTATITVTPTFNNGGVNCVGTPSTFTITVNPTVVINTVANQVVCNGSPVTAITFGTTATGGTTTYAWTNNTTSIGLAASGTGNIATFNGINTGTIPVTATITVIPTFNNGGVNCVGTSRTFTITVNPIPTVNAVANQAFCNAVSSTPTAFTGAVTGTVYSWTNTNTAIGLAASGTGNLPTFVPTNAGTAPITATITVTPSFTNAGVTCTGANTSFVITVNPTTRITVQPVSSSICFGSSTAFTVAATGLNLTYQWQIDYGTGFNNIAGATNATYQVAIPPNGGINFNGSKYRCIVTGTCGIENSNTVTLTILPTPTVSISAAPISLLQPFQTTNVLANVSPVGGSFKWYYNDVLITGANAASFGPIGINNLGNYKFVYTDLNGCVASSNNQVISGNVSENVWIYPIPNKGQFNVRLYNQDGERFKVWIYSRNRELIYKADLTTGSMYSATTVNLTNQPSGTYILIITNSLNKELVNKQIVIVR